MKKFLTFVLFSTFALAESFSVSTTAELRQAMNVAEKNSVSDKIYIQEGTYTVIDDGVGTFEYESNESLSLIGVGKVVLSGYDLTRIFQIDSNETVKFQNLTLTKGKIYTGNTDGTAIKSIGSGTIEILDSNITENSNTALYGNLDIYNSNFYNSFVNGDIKGLSKATIFNSNIKFININLQNLSNMSIVNSTFYRSKINSGDNISILYSEFYNSSIERTDNVIIENSNFYDESYINIDISLIIKHSTFKNNMKVIEGKDETNITIVSSIFEDNSASNEGVIYGGNNSNIKIFNSVFINNLFSSSSTSNTGIILGHDLLSLIVINSIFYNNSRYDIYFDSGNAVIYNNYLGTYNIYQHPYGTSIATIQDNFSTGLIWKDENLSIPDENSSTVDAGMNLNSGVATYLLGQDFIDKISPLLQTDKYCNNRIENGTIDIGAFEFGGVETDSCEFNTTENPFDRNYSDNITIDNNQSCGDGWSFDENRSLCVKDDEMEYDTSDFSTVPIDQGWSLRAVDVNVSEIPSFVSILWTYSDGNWSAFSPNGEFTQKISDSAFQRISKPLSSENGTWFKSDRDFDLIVQKEISDEIETPTPPSLKAHNLGWNLLGTARELPAELISCENGEKTLMWKFFKNEWLLFAPNINPSLYDLMFNTVLANEGFWVLCE
jgi:hypothetical protein